MARFTDDNTEGYSADDLAALNTAFEHIFQCVDSEAKSLLDHISETLMVAYDMGLRDDALVSSSFDAKSRP